MTMITPAYTALERAAAAIGSRRALAKALGISHQAIYKWKRVPLRWVDAVEGLSGVPRHELRPDIYPREDAA